MDSKQKNPNSVPDFIGIGAARSGTTWLHTQLKAQKDVWLPPVKEVHYFDRSPDYNSPNKLAIESPVSRILNPANWDARTCLKFLRDASLSLANRNDASISWWLDWYLGKYNDTWYRKLFLERKEALKGEITPAYGILDKKDIQKIYQLNPKIKLIYLLRNPIERDWSSLRKSVDRGHLTLDLTSIHEIKNTLIQQQTADRSDYLKTISHYLEVFPADQLLIGFYEAINDAPGKLLEEIMAFLGVEPLAINFSLLSSKINASPKVEIPIEIQKLLSENHEKTIKEVQRVIGSYSNDWLGDILEEDRSTSLATVRADQLQF